MAEILDFTVYSDTDRAAYIEKKIAGLGRNPSQKELDLWSNYILYGKDSGTGRSVVDEGLVEIPTKYGSYKRKKDKNLSLNELMESPTFSESELKPIEKPLYTTPKPKLNPNLAELEPLREQIAVLEERYKKAEAELTSSPGSASLTATQLYHLKHEIISLKSQQYIVQDSVTPTLMLRSQPHFEFHPDNLEIEVWPLGLKMDNSARWTDPRNAADDWWDTYGDASLVDPGKYIIDFTNLDHIYYLIENWGILQAAAAKNGTSDEWYLLATFGYYLDRTYLNPVRQDILRLKMAEQKNAVIREYVNRVHGTTYNENYISTIYRGNICKSIAATARLHYDEWLQRGNKSAWKRCEVCGKWKLRNADQFGRKYSAKDGLSNTCRQCGKEKRHKAAKGGTKLSWQN